MLAYLFVLLLVVLFAGCLQLHETEKTLTWQKTFGGPQADIARSVQQTSDGGYIIGGFTYSYGAGDADCYLVKTDARGNEQWAKTFGGLKEDVARSVQQTSDGGYIIGGHTFSYGAGGGDFYLVKTDANGNEQWARTFGGKADDGVLSLQLTSDGGYILAGVTYSYGAGDGDFYLVKTDANGNEQWAKTFGGAKMDIAARSVQQTSDGGYVLVGGTYSYGAGDADFYLVKTDAGGNEQWTRTFGGAGEEIVYSVQQTPDGGYILAGYTRSYGEGNADFYLVKTDAKGNEQWSKTFGGREGDFSPYIVKTSDGGYVFTGYTYSFGAGQSDFYLVKIDANGNEQWARTYGGSNHDTAFYVQQTSDGGYIIGGSTYSYGAGDADFYLVKTDAEGNCSTTPQP